MAASCGDGTLTFSGGEGTSSSPFLIKTEADLVSLNDHYPVNSNINSVYYGCSYLQVADITLTSTWAHGIGFTTDGPAIWASWHGVYDGNGYAISNLRIDPNSLSGANQPHEIGFIGHTDTSAAVVRNVNLINATVTCSVKTEFSALLVGETVGPVSRSSASGTVNCTNADRLARMGGLIGYTSGSVTDCSVSGTVTIPTVYTFQPNAVGGIIGKTDVGASVQRVLSRVTLVNPLDGIWVGVAIGTQGGAVLSSYAQDGLTGGIGLIGNGTQSGLALKSALQLKDISTYSGWSITPGINTSAIWGISASVNDGFAFLQPFVRSGDESKAPQPLFQQVPAHWDGTCIGINDEVFAYGTGLTGGWTPSWAQWARGGLGGPVCGRVLVFRGDRWVISI